MSRWGRCDFSQLEDFAKRFAAADVDGLCRAGAKELAARLLALVIPATPVGRYPKGAGKKGGTLRRGWTARTQAEAESGKKADVRAWVQSLPVTKSGGGYMIEVINPVEYASYVEFGHRTRGGGGFVEGRRMLTVSEEQLRKIAPAALEKLLHQKLKELCDGGN